MSALQKPSASKPYYVNVQLQMSAEEGEKTVKVDRKLKNAIMDAIEPQGGGGRQTSVKELSRIVKNIVDGNRYGEGEKALVRALFRATDDRYDVKINGVKVRITDPAEVSFIHSMHVFFGGLSKGGLKNMSGQTATQLIQSFAQSQQSGGAAQQAG
jgi:hypothetical protein